MDTSNKPKTIATIDVNLTWKTPDRKAWLDESVSDHLECVLCGSELQFAHKADFIEQTVVEHAHCPSCNIRNRESKHRIQ